MADRFWVGGTATWDATVGTKWSTTSGGVGGSTVPTAVDDVFFDAASGVVVCTLSNSSVCRSLDCLGYTGTITHPAATTLTIGSGTAGAGNRALRLVAGMTYTFSNATTSAYSFVSTSATVQTIESGSKTFSNITFNGAGGSWQLAAAFTAGATATLTLTTGTLDTNNQAVSVGLFSSAAAGTRTLTLGSTTWTATGAGVSWSASSTLTLNANTSTISQTSASATTFTGGTKTYNTVSRAGNNATNNISDANTYANLTFLSGANLQFVMSLAANQTVTGTFTATGTTATQRVFVTSSVLATARTITAAVVSLANVDFSDITAAGAAIPFAGTGLGDGGGNTSITFSAPLSRFWVGGTGSWSATARWSATSGGVGSAGVPLIHDVAIFNASSGAGTLTLDMPRVATVDFTSSSLTGYAESASTVISTFGSWVTVGSMVGVYTTNAKILRARTGSWSVGTASQAHGAITISAPGATYAAVSSLFLRTGTFTVSHGSFNASTFSVMAVAGAITISTIDTVSMGSGVWLVGGTATVWNHTQTLGSGTLNPDTATIVVSDQSTTGKTVNMRSGYTYPAFVIVRSAAIYTWSINAGSVTIASISAIGAFRPMTWTFSASRNVTLTNPIFPSGAAGNLITVSSSTGGSPFALISSDGLTLQYMSLRDITASGGIPFFAGNSTNVSGNTGWTFATRRPFLPAARLVATGRSVASGRSAAGTRTPV